MAHDACHIIQLIHTGLRLWSIQIPSTWIPLQVLRHAAKPLFSTDQLVDLTYTQSGRAQISECSSKHRDSSGMEPWSFCRNKKLTCLKVVGMTTRHHFGMTETQPQVRSAVKKSVSTPRPLLCPHNFGHRWRSKEKAQRRVLGVEDFLHFISTNEVSW